MKQAETCAKTYFGNACTCTLNIAKLSEALRRKWAGVAFVKLRHSLTKKKTKRRNVKKPHKTQTRNAP